MDIYWHERLARASVMPSYHFSIPRRYNFCWPRGPNLLKPKLQFSKPIFRGLGFRLCYRSLGMRYEEQNKPLVKFFHAGYSSIKVAS
jgi:hypothetical protein